MDTARARSRLHGRDWVDGLAQWKPHFLVVDADVVPMTAAIATVTAPSRYRRSGLRMSCHRCDVAWTGEANSDCWVCASPGMPGPAPTLYPEFD